MKLIQYSLFGAFIALFFSCKKQSATIIAPQPPNPAKTYIVLKETPDTSYISEKGYVEVKGVISGERENYNLMEAFLVDQNADTLGKATVDGINFTFRLDSTLAAGEYHVAVIAQDPDNDNKTISSSTVDVFACYPRPVKFQGFQVSQRNISLTWGKENLYNFKQYELYSTRAGENAKLIATITDPNTTTFVDTSNYFFYEYRYDIRVVNTQDCSSRPDSRIFRSGHALDLYEGADILSSVYHEGKGTFHFMMPINSSYYLIEVDADSIDGAFAGKAYIPGSYLAGLDETNKLQVVQPVNYSGIWQINWFDVTSRAYDIRPVTTNLPLYADRIKIIWDNLALYSSNHDNKDFVAMYDHNTQQKTPVWDGGLLNVLPIKNNERFVITSATDSFFIYSMTSGTPELQKKGSIPGLSQLARRNVFSGAGMFTIGGNLYDDNYNLKHSLNAGETFIGLSADGQYAVTNKNEIYETTGFNMLDKYGDGVGGVVYFSKDNSTLVHIVTTHDDYNRDRMFQYRWRE